MPITFTNERVAGFLPLFFSERDPRPAADQLDERYTHGGGYLPISGFSAPEEVDGVLVIKYPGDPALREVSRATLRDELLVLMESSFLLIIQSSGDYVVCRVD